MRSQDRLSLIIPTHNREKQLRRTLTRLDLEDICSSNTEVILVDNASSDNTPAIIADFRHSVAFPVVAVFEPKIGSGNAKNAGLKAASGAYSIFTDDDCYLEEGYFIKARRIFSEQNIHYGSGWTLLYDESDASEAINTNNTPIIFPPFSPIQPGQILGTNMFFKEEVIQQIGCFDPLFGSGTPFSCDDLEYASRCSQAGFKGHYLPDLVVYHHHGRKRHSPEMAQRMREYYYAIGAYYMRSLIWAQWKGLLQFASRVPNRELGFKAFAGALHYLFLYIFGRRCA